MPLSIRLKTQLMAKLLTFYKTDNINKYCYHYHACLIELLQSIQFQVGSDINGILQTLCACAGTFFFCAHIFSTFFQTFGDFGITRKLIFFSLPMANFTAEKHFVWKILMKMCLVMVTIIKLTH